MREIVGLYLNPPENNAVILYVDEKNPMQALECSQPMLPMDRAIGMRYARLPASPYDHAIRGTGHGQGDGDRTVPAASSHQEYWDFSREIEKNALRTGRPRDRGPLCHA